jgi:rhamnose transport system ATP-binding protein
VAPDAERERDVVLAMHGISKSFGGTLALDDAHIALHSGEVHSLLGENGAGKSTLIKIMTGLHRADHGEVSIDGEPAHVNSPAEAQRHGIVAIYQEPLIFPDLSVAENVFMAHRDRGVLMNWDRLNRDATEILSRLDVALDPTAPASSLTVGEQQAVEIAKAMSQDVRVLIMDEPTAALSAHEVRRLFRQVDHLRETGVAVLFISHRLDEVFEISDRITVFRDGKHISTRLARDTDEAQVVREMVGRELGDFFVRTHSMSGEAVIEVDGLARDGAFYDVSFEVHRGEVLGFAGLVGAGRTDVGLALFGIAPADAGEVRIEGEPVAIRSPRDALDHGIAYLSEDRRKLGLSMPQSVAANISLPTLDRYIGRMHLLDRPAERAAAERFRDGLSIRTPSLDAPVENLSGGNQQKVMIAKWLNTEPKVLVLDEPTRGIDVGAKADVHRLIDDLASQGMAVILISSDLPEVLAMSDRVVVMREGRKVADIGRDDVDQERVMTAAIGTA